MIGVKDLNQLYYHITQYLNYSNYYEDINSFNSSCLYLDNTIII